MRWYRTPALLGLVAGLAACPGGGGSTTGTSGSSSGSTSVGDSSGSGSTSSTSGASSASGPLPTSSGTGTTGDPTGDSASTSTSSTTGTTTGTTGPGGAIENPCELPGSLHFTENGTVLIPGDPGPVDLAFLHLPVGFCAHYFANVGNARQLRFAPGGELFVASPTTPTTGGGPNGQAAIVVLVDDDLDGVADAPITFLDQLPSTQGLLFAPDSFYYQDGTRILRLPYQAGDRSPAGASEQVADITYYASNLHWPKVLDMADDGSIYVSNGGDQGEACVVPHPFHGGIRRLDGTPDGAPVAQGLRNPLGLRCAVGHNRCFALELGKDYSQDSGGREKMVPIRDGDDWGYPCCATLDLPYMDIPPTDCSSVAQEDVSFRIGDTPFGLAFAPTRWPAPWGGKAMVAMHGAAGTWIGARIVAVAMDPDTGLPLPGHDLLGPNTGSLSDFATGWDDGTLSHGRPAPLDVSTDGRLFVGNDNNGDILWIAPL